MIVIKIFTNFTKTNTHLNILLGFLPGLWRRLLQVRDWWRWQWTPKHCLDFGEVGRSMLIQQRNGLLALRAQSCGLDVKLHGLILRSPVSKAWGHINYTRNGKSFERSMAPSSGVYAWSHSTDLLNCSGDISLLSTVVKDKTHGFYYCTAAVTICWSVTWGSSYNLWVLVSKLVN